MKYLEFIFRTSPCTEIVNDVLVATLGDAGFESFVEQEDGIAAYIQKELYDEATVKTAENAAKNGVRPPYERENDHVPYL